MHPRPFAEVLPDPLVQRCLFDRVASNPVPGLIFLAATRLLAPPYSADRLGRALVPTIVSADSQERALLYRTIQDRLRSNMIGENGYFRVLDGAQSLFGLTPDFLFYKQRLVTTLIDLQLDFPGVMANMLGEAKPNRIRSGHPSCPSLSLGLYKMMADHPDGLLPLEPDDTLLSKYHIKIFPQQNARGHVRDRIARLVRKGLMRRGADGTRLRDDLLPFATELVRRMGELTVTHVSDETANRALMKRAESILADQTIVGSLLSAIKRGSKDKEVRPAAMKETRPVTAMRDAPARPGPLHTTPSVFVRLNLRPGNYPANWLVDGRCQRGNVDPELFAIDPSGPKSPSQTNKAQSICKLCAVRGPCLRAALVADNRQGIAALSPDERAALTSAERREIIGGINVAPLRARPVT